LIAEEWFGHGTIRCGISYEQGVKAERERQVKWMEQFIPDGHLEHEECDDCLVIRTVIAMIKDEQ
jgi:hypothetical protein